jgi:acyl-CoA reductase-like NAD-dependent aldehyde dehydrogenase
VTSLEQAGRAPAEAGPATAGPAGAGDPTELAAARAAAGRARESFAAWGSLPPVAREPHLRALRRTVSRSADRIAEVVCGETGKSRADAVLAEALHAAAHADWCARHAARLLAPSKVSPWPLYSKAAWVEYQPRGVAAVISPWNYPFLLPFLATTSALAAGCTVVLKPSDVTPASGALVAELVAEAGLPDGVVQVLHGGPETGSALVQAGVDLVAVTGSTATGRRVAALAAERLLPVIMELGGKDPMVVLEDADLGRAARAAVWGACFNAGQSCVAVERVYVIDGVHDRFVAELERAFSSVRAGGGGARDIGPIAHPPQLEVIERQVADAVARGARLLRGGQRTGAGGRWFEPTLLTEVDHTMAVMREETFGPVLPVMRVPDEEAAVRMANDSPFGLHASLWTADSGRARRAASRLRAGAVAINDCLVNYAMPGLPFGGVADSGYGRQGGAEGLRAYCYTRTVTWSRITPRRELQWFPRRLGARSWKRALRLLYGR